MQFFIKIPENADLLLKNGQSVDFDTPLMNSSQVTQLKIELAKKLSIPQDKIFRHLKKFVGDSVTKGDPLAIKKDFFSTKKINSPVDGVVKEIDHVEGVLLIDTQTESKAEVYCYFKGEVIEVGTDHIELKTGKGIETSLKKTELSLGGKTCYITSTVEEDLKKLEIENSVVVTEALSSYLQAKCEALGARGFVTLMKLPDQSGVPSVIIKEINDFKKIVHAAHPYCTVDAGSDTIYFYES